MDSPTPPVGAARQPATGWAAHLATWRARLSGRWGAVLAGIAAVGAAVVAAVLLLRQPFGPPPQLTLPKASEAGADVPSSAPAPGAPATPAIVTVHAAGAVARPGVYALPSGARVADVLTAAGGPTPEADVDRLNLAARVGDGERVTVARKGDPSVASGPGPPANGVAGGEGDAGTGAGGGPGGAGPAGSGPVTPIDLNSATAEQLDTLPGVGPATARSIISYRQRHGRFRSVTELLEVPGIGPTKMEALRPLVKV